VVLTADSILARSTRRRQTSTGWNTAYIGANRYTLPPDEKPPADDALHPMAFLVEKGPGALTRPHFHQADQFQVVVAGRGMLGDHEFSDGAVQYTDAYSAYGPIVAEGGSSYEGRITRRGDQSPEAMREKACFVLGAMERRIAALGFGWADVTATQVYPSAPGRRVRPPGSHVGRFDLAFRAPAGAGPRFRG
jgi:hypothetical protein